MKPELYVSVDIETNGPCPGKHSMLSLGAYAFYADGADPVQPFFYRNLLELENGERDPDTMKWWETQPAAWARLHEPAPLKPEHAMPQFYNWVSALPGKPTFVGYPAGFDFTFVYWYLHVFCGRSPFGFSAIDIKSYAMAVLGTQFRGTVKRVMPKDWFEGADGHTHVALDDAFEQGKMFQRILQSAHSMRVNAAEITRIQDQLIKKATDFIMTGESVEAISKDEVPPAAPTRFSCCEGTPGVRSI